MYHATRDYGRKGSVIAAISGVDIALWDIAGKARGAPVAKLLGGAFRNEVQAYATGFYRLRGQGEAPRLAEEAIAHAEAGFTAKRGPWELAAPRRGDPARAMFSTTAPPKQ